MPFLTQVFTLRYSFGLADFLSRYAVFMAIAPLALWLIAKRKTWIVGAVSVLVWATLRGTDGLAPFSGWQIIFFAGLVLGYYYPQIKKYIRSMKTKTKKRCDKNDHLPRFRYIYRLPCCI